MDLPSFPSMYNPLFSPQNEFYQTSTSTSLINDQIKTLDDILIPTIMEVPQVHHLEDVLKIPSFLGNNDGLAQPRKASSLLDDDINPNDSKKKHKIVHREIERQRRFEMSSLHASLRNLLPHEYIKGKRAMSDHLGGAVRYIRQLQQSMKELHDQREALKREVTLKNPKPHNRDVKVEGCKGGVEVIVTTSCEVDGDTSDQKLPLSKVLECLIQQGLDVVNCISQRVENNSKLVHSIHAQYVTPEVIDKSVTIDLQQLQQKLEDL